VRRKCWGFSGGSTSFLYWLRNTLASGSQLMVHGLEVCYVQWMQVRLECKSNGTPRRNQVGNAPGVMGRVRRVEILLQGIHDPACDSVLSAHKTTFTFCCVLIPSLHFTVISASAPKAPWKPLFGPAHPASVVCRHCSILSSEVAAGPSATRARLTRCLQCGRCCVPAAARCTSQHAGWLLAQRHLLLRRSAVRHIACRHP
jgi:hypothetical protein